jgi:hypothetical protein
MPQRKPPRDVELSGHYRILYRALWNARDPKKEFTPFKVYLDWMMRVTEFRFVPLEKYLKYLHVNKFIDIESVDGEDMSTVYTIRIEKLIKPYKAPDPRVLTTLSDGSIINVWEQAQLDFVPTKKKGR